jgi:ADP-ribose pyrophosphatase YjhB (NUDIX family)
MAIAVIKDGNEILLRKFDPARNPYTKPWGLFGGRLEGDGSVVELLNKELKDRWNMTVRITEPLTWSEETKTDHDGEEKRFLYLDTLCELATGNPNPVNKNEELRWVEIAQLDQYDHIPPGLKLFKKLGYIK